MNEGLHQYLRSDNIILDASNKHYQNIEGGQIGSALLVSTLLGLAYWEEASSPIVAGQCLQAVDKVAEEKVLSLPRRAAEKDAQ